MLRPRKAVPMVFAINTIDISVRPLYPRICRAQQRPDSRKKGGLAKVILLPSHLP
jgi:hypothetical protein